MEARINGAKMGKTVRTVQDSLGTVFQLVLDIENILEINKDLPAEKRPEQVTHRVNQLREALDIISGRLEVIKQSLDVL